MHNMLMITFDGEEQAYNGATALGQLHETSAIAVYASTILARAEDGSIDTLQQGSQGPLGTATGLMAGSIIGLLGGPGGLVAGAALGAAGGAAIDHWDVELRKEMFDEVSQALQPGKFVVIADVAEPSEEIVNEKVAELGGAVTRKPRSKVIGAHVEHRLAQKKSELQQLEEKMAHALDDVKVALGEKVRVAREKLKDAWKKTSENLKADAAARKKVLEERIAHAPEDIRKSLDTAKESAQAEADCRIAQLHDEFDH